jgi:hypothetical protein
MSRSRGGGAGIAFVDGKYYSERDAKISVFDHGLLYGDGVLKASAPTMAACSS